MTGNGDRVSSLVERVERAWRAFQCSYAGLSDARMTEPGVVGDWSVKDVIAHVTTWEEEALKHLPLIIAGGRPPRYVTVGGIDAFNDRVTMQKRGLSLAEVLRESDHTHRRLIAFIESVPQEAMTGETRARRRLRLDTYGHYSLHTEAVQTWRDAEPAGAATHADAP